MENQWFEFYISPKEFVSGIEEKIQMKLLVFIKLHLEGNSKDVALFNRLDINGGATFYLSPLGCKIAKPLLEIYNAKECNDPFLIEPDKLLFAGGDKTFRDRNYNNLED